MTEPSINLHSSYAAMRVSAPDILASILHHAAAKSENCFPCLVNIYFFYCKDSGFCYFTEPMTFSSWRKNFEYDEETNAGLYWRFFSQVNQQNEQRRQRRAWLWPRPQNWFHRLLASQDLNFLWKELFRVTRETFENLCTR